MGLETATQISELVESWPLQTDKIRQGAGHLRAIKAAVKGSFPNITAPVTVTAAALNTLPTNFSSVLTEILKHVPPVGFVGLWSGSANAVPAGWALCNGQTVAGYGTTPNLTDRFVVGAGGSYSTGEIGGGVSKETDPNGKHTPIIQGHSLTAAEGPPHQHVGANFAGSSDDNADPGPLIETSSVQANGTMSSSSFTTSISGSGAPHSHTADEVPDHTHTLADTRPPYYALCYIIKVTAFVMP